MSIKSKLNRSLGLENLLEIPVADNDAFDDVGTVVDAVMPDGTPTPEADTVELEIVYNAAYTSEQDLEELIEASQGIESVCLAMYIDQRDGGLTQQSARYAALALESVGAPYDITARDMGMVSLESFDGDRSRATSVSMEGLLDTLKGWWEAIVRKFKELLAKLNKYWQQSWSAAARLKSRAEALKAKSRNVSGTMTERNLEDASLYSALNIRGKVVPAAQLITAYNQLSVPVKSPMQTDKVEAVISKFFDDLKWDNLNAGAETWRASIMSMITIPAGKLDSTFKVNDITPDFNYLKGIGGLPGNKAVVFGLNIPTTLTTTDKVLKQFTFKVADDDKDFKTPSTKPKLPTLTASEVETLCDAVITAMDTAIRNKSDGAKSVKLAKKVEDEGNSFMRDAPTDVDATKSAQASALMSDMVSIAKEVQSGNTQVLRYAMRTTNSMLSYAAKSLSKFKKS